MREIRIRRNVTYINPEFYRRGKGRFLLGRSTCIDAVELSVEVEVVDDNLTILASMDSRDPISPPLERALAGVCAAMI